MVAGGGAPPPRGPAALRLQAALGSQADTEDPRHENCAVPPTGFPAVRLRDEILMRKEGDKGDIQAPEWVGRFVLRSSL